MAGTERAWDATSRRGLCTSPARAPQGQRCFLCYSYSLGDDAGSGAPCRGGIIPTRKNGAPARAKAKQKPAADPNRLLRQIPSVEEVLGRSGLRELGEQAGRKFLAARVRETLAELRREILEAGAAPADLTESGITGNSIEDRVRAAVARALAYSLRPVINATGVILHTNLGRAPLSREALEHAAEVAAQYSNLEYDLASGRRGQRDVHLSRQLTELLGAEAAIAVNNNAAAVLITLNTLAEGGEVIVSRGELIEIGGSFRIPEIMQKSGAVLREVGTTNRTRIDDYEKAVNERTRLLLRVHPSNFRIVGFTEKPSLEELVALGKKTGVAVFEDLGSGCMVSLAAQGIPDETPARDSLAAGADVVSFSGDKMLGGPQAGLIAGRAELVGRIRRNPLFRALRVDKLTYAALETTLQAYRQDQPDRIPALRMIRMTAAEVGERAGRLLEACAAGRGGPLHINSLHIDPLDIGPLDIGPLHIEMIDGESVIGGGSAPGQSLPTRLIALRHADVGAASLGARLQARTPPVIARVEADAVLLDLRTVLPEQESTLAEAVRSLASG